ncbi:ArsR/SmtB family transcription factor [Staphylococcus shinii]|uniref:ArsR/SmtB family transcription factor n=1 Tax=Staphylococcus shinii TaxID=2912228 RepID=UPI003EEE1288
MKNTDELKKLANEFQECQNILIAIGDETRQSIMLALIEVGCNEGMRVGEIARKTHLSRPSVSYHLKILKESNIVTLEKIGTKNFYYINPENTSIKALQKMINHMNNYIEKYNIPKEEREF